MTHASPLSFPIINEADALAVKRSARELAAQIGFHNGEEEELLLVVSELASNLIKHSQGGRLTLTPVEAAERRGLEIESTDQGPGISDPEAALQDGFSTAGSLGYGLGTINRLTDEMEITSAPGAGTRVTCLRWVRVRTHVPSGIRLDVGVATRARGGLIDNGDAFVVKQWENHALGGIIDGLGHGPHAARAACAARNYIETHFDQPLESILRGTDRACRSTRGAVVGLVKIDFQTSLTFIGVGNVEARIFSKDRVTATVSQRGIVGGNMPTPKTAEYKWGPDHVLVMHSDGIKAHWHPSEFPGIERDEARLLARRLMLTLGSPEDDATVLVMKSSPE